MKIVQGVNIDECKKTKTNSIQEARKNDDTQIGKNMASCNHEDNQEPLVENNDVSKQSKTISDDMSSDESLTTKPIKRAQKPSKGAAPAPKQVKNSETTSKAKSAQLLSSDAEIKNEPLTPPKKKSSSKQD